MGLEYILVFITAWSVIGNFFVAPICALILTLQWISSIRHRNRSVLYWRSAVLVIWSAAALVFWIEVMSQPVRPADWIFWHPLFLLFSVMAVVVAAFQPALNLQPVLNAGGKLWSGILHVVGLFTVGQFLAFLALSALSAYGLWGMFLPSLPPFLGGVEPGNSNHLAQELAALARDRMLVRYSLMAGVGAVGAGLVLRRARSGKARGDSRDQDAT